MASRGADQFLYAGTWPAGNLLLGESGLVAQLERKFKLVAFFNRVPLEDLALAFPEAAECSSKEELLRPHLEVLRALVLLALESAPLEVGRLAEQYPDVARMLAKYRPGS